MDGFRGDAYQLDFSLAGCDSAIVRSSLKYLFQSEDVVWVADRHRYPIRLGLSGNRQGALYLRRLASLLDLHLTTNQAEEVSRFVGFAVDGLARPAALHLRFECELLQISIEHAAEERSLLEVEKRLLKRVIA